MGSVHWAWPISPCAILIRPNMGSAARNDGEGQWPSQLPVHGWITTRPTAKARLFAASVLRENTLAGWRTEKSHGKTSAWQKHRVPPLHSLQQRSATSMERNLVWDTGMIEMFDQDSFEHLTLSAHARQLAGACGKNQNTYLTAN